MALHKFSKPKSFHVDYCGCTAAALLLNESSIRDAIHLVRKVKSKQEFMKTTMSVAKDGIGITYENEQKYATHVPSSMIAGATNGKSSLHDTVGVVYISPLTGRHYPAFVHVYRCDSSRTAQKLLVRLRAYTHMENHRLNILQIERQLLDQNLLNLDYYNVTKNQSQMLTTTVLNSNQKNTGISSSSSSSNGRQDKNDPVKSITEEFQKKIDSQQPLLFPPKDYDAVHAGHGNIRKAQAWKSTEPTIVGYTPVQPDHSRIQRQAHANNRSFSHTSIIDGLKTPEIRNDLIENDERPRFRTQSSDMTIDPVETVSLAFKFLKDETGSITTEHDGDIEYLDIEEQDQPAIYRFRPPQVTPTLKKHYTRNNHQDLSTGLPQPNTSLTNELNSYYNHTHHQQQRMPAGHRTRSETNLYYDPEPGMHLSPRYERRLVNRSGGPISTNPLWTAASPIIIGSQPNLLSHQKTNGQVPFYRHLSPLNDRRMPSVPLQHPLYASYPINKPPVTLHQQENQQKRLGSAPLPPPSHSDKRYPTKPQYLDTNEFILRASNEQLLKNSQYLNRPTKDMSRDYRSQSINVNGNSNTMLDVYY